MWVYVVVYTHTHTLTARRVLGVKHRGQNETPGGPKESGWTKSWYACIRICVQNTHVYVYSGRRDACVI